MLNKLKRSVKYIIKKIKRGIEIVAKNINDVYVCKCEIESKKLDMVKSAGSTIHDDIKSVGTFLCNGGKNFLSRINKPEYKIIIGFSLVAIGIVDKLKEV